MRVRLRKGGRDVVDMWAIVEQEPCASFASAVDPDPARLKAFETRDFSIEMTGDDRPYIKPTNYVGTFDDGPYVLHVFEVRR